MKVQLKEKTYFINWKYEQVPVAEEKFRNQSPVQEITSCTILDSDKKIICSAAITKYHKDISCKKTARRIAFNRVINCAGFTRDERTALWENFHKNVKLK